MKLKAKVDYFYIKKGDIIEAIEFVEAPKGYCSYYRTLPSGTNKIHYMYTAEVEEV